MHTWGPVGEESETAPAPQDGWGGAGEGNSWTCPDSCSDAVAHAEE